MADPKRRLPVLGAAPAPPDDDERPPWHWSAIGAVVTFALWLPLAMLALALSRRLLDGIVAGDSRASVGAFTGTATGGQRVAVYAASLGPPLLAFVAGVFAAGALVGRFGGKAGAREAAIGGFAAATIAWALAASESGLLALLPIWPPVVALGALGAYAGGRVGVARRR